MNKVEATIKGIPAIDQALLASAQSRLDNLTKPLGSLGRLEELAKQIVGITGKESPALKDKVIFTLAADHGVTEEGISAFPKEVTAQMVYNFLNNGAGINVLAGHVGARVVVADIGVASELKIAPEKSANFRDKKVAFGTRNFARGPAMTMAEAIKAVEAGIELLEEEVSPGLDIAGTGEMGIGNTTASSAIAAAVTGIPAAEVVGRGTGLDDRAMKNKIAVIERALALHRPDPEDAFGLLQKVGGLEIAGMAGIFLAGARHRVPVVIDGFISGAAALIAYKIAPQSKDYMIASHCSVEKGHKVILDYLGLKPLFDLNLRLGEGTGAALGIDLAEASLKILTQMATFESAAVSKE